MQTNTQIYSTDSTPYVNFSLSTPIKKMNDFNRKISEVFKKNFMTAFPLASRRRYVARILSIATLISFGIMALYYTADTVGHNIDPRSKGTSRTHNQIISDGLVATFLGAAGLTIIFVSCYFFRICLKNDYNQWKQKSLKELDIEKGRKFRVDNKAV